MATRLFLGVFLVFAALKGDQEKLPSPIFPPNTIGGGTVVALLQVSSGSVSRVEFLSGGEPFTGSSQEALIRWKLAASQKQQQVLAVVMFRNPNYYAVGGQSRLKAPEQRDPTLPFPTKVVEPAYLPNAASAGSVVLQLEISADGKVTDARPVKEFGILTDTSREAVLHWQFQPAKNASGVNVASQAYAVLVFTSPILSPAPRAH